MTVTVGELLCFFAGVGIVCIAAGVLLLVLSGVNDYPNLRRRAQMVINAHSPELTITHRALLAALDIIEGYTVDYTRLAALEKEAGGD